MKANRKLVIVLAVLLVAMCGASLAWSDPPARVGRLNLITGTVSFHPGSVEDWSPAALNYPMTAGDALWADQDGEAEIHVGSTAIRLASNTEISFLNLDDQTTQIRLSTGSLNLRLRRLEAQEVVEIDAPNSSFTLTQPGSYRVDVQETGDTSLTVRSGEAEGTAGDSSFSVFSNQAVDINGIDSPTYEVSAADPPDEWDQWCQSRDARENRMAATRYVPREMIGVEDLDGNGVWRVAPGYGTVWQPTVVVAGWAPYRYGHWAWVDPWGWTWIDDAPWGFAPFHYGRWAFFDGSWVWVPGRIVARPVYAPALVVFVGGGGWGTTVVAGGGVGWFPLGPREPYVPPYTASNVYVRNVNISHVTVVNVQSVNVTTYRYVNRSVPGAVVAVPNQAFVRAQPVHASAVVVSNDEVLRAPVRGGYAPVAPVRESVLGQSMRGPVARPPATVLSRPVVARVAPPPPPVPFDARQKALEAHPGRPVDPGTLSTLRRGSPGQNPPVVIVNPQPRGQVMSPGSAQPRRVQGGQGQPVYPQGQQGPRVVTPGPASGQPVQRAPGQQPGAQQGQPAPRMQQGQGPRGPQSGVQQGQPGPRVQPGVRRGQQGQALPPGQGPQVRPQEGPREKPGPAPGPSSSDELKKKRPQDQGGQNQGGN
ncbi:MAG TPA: DUF6600 domain-containing protein [Spirochaetia bacterium]|nr:DUF6600 domain-containing protein [Spirochaetia bacterium]